MRLNAAEIKTIVQTAQEIFGLEVSVYLFGSRIDDTKRGGDIDLLVCTPCGKQSVLGPYFDENPSEDAFGRPEDRYCGR